MHSYSDEEKNAFATLINHALKDDKRVFELGLLPINPEDESCFDNVSDGIILCKLIDKCQPGLVEDRFINTKEKINIFQKKENLNMAIQSAQTIGVKTIGMHPGVFLDKTKHMILGVLWQLLKIYLFSLINIKNNPGLIRLVKEDETLEDLQALPVESILLRWVNYHLDNAGHDQRVKNFSDDVKDGVNYTVLLNQL